MTTLQDRLRASPTSQIMQEAADALDALRAEAKEQARLLGISAERELAMRAENERLRIELRALIRGYVNLMESGRDRIIDLGGQCDPVDVMEANDPWLRSARAALIEQEQGNADSA